MVHVYLHICLILFSSFFISQCSNTQLKLNTIYNLSLQASSNSTFTLQLPTDLPPNQNLYISAYSPTNNPYEQPTLSISSDDYSQLCETDSSNLNNVCFVASENLKGGKTFNIWAYCQIGCQARIVAYLSQVIQLDLGEKVQVSSQDSPVEVRFRVVVGQRDFSEVRIVYQLNRIGAGSVQMYIKCSKNVSYPTKDNHDNITIIRWGPKWAAILEKQKYLKDGESIDIYVQIPANSNLQLQSRIVTTNTYNIQLNQQYFDYLIPPFQSHTYNIDLRQYSTSIFANDITIQVMEFSGSPKLEVSFSPDFGHEQLVDQVQATTAVRFIVTADMMKTAQFNKVIYLRVSTQHGASFSIYPRLRYNNSNIATIQPGVTQYLQIPSQQPTSTLLYSLQVPSSPNLTITRKLTVEWTSQGEGDALLNPYMCSLPKILNCNVPKNTSVQAIDQKIFKILNVGYGFQFVQIQYKVSEDCLKIQDAFLCNFVFVFVPMQKSKTVKYVVRIVQDNQVRILQEGKSYTARVHKQQYNYYSFHLPTSSINNNLQQLTFFIHQIDGSTKLLASTLVTTPTLQDLPNINIKQGVSNISFRTEQLLNDYIYLSVYGIEYSEYIVTAIARRKTSNGQSGEGGINYDQKFNKNVVWTDFSLSDGVAQTYSLERGNNIAKFRFKVYGNGNVTLVVTELIGKVSTHYTRESNHSRKACEDNQCIFQASAGQSFFVQVQGPEYLLQKFSIVYKQTKQCYRYPIGTPVFVSLDAKDTECLQFWILPQFSLQASSSLTKLQMLNKQAEIAIQFSQNSTFVMTSNSYLFSSDNLRQYCSNQQTNCKIKIKFISFANSVELQFVLQKIDGVITLYDGVLQKIDTIISKTNIRRFRYPLNIDDNVEIFLTTETNSEYLILAKIVNAQESNSINNYPTFASQNQSSVWKMVTSDDLPSLMLLPIHKYKLRDAARQLNVTYPWLIISVLGNVQDLQHVIFDIQVTQSERSLREGQQHIGFIQANQIVSYEVYSSPLSLLSIRSLYTDRCFTILDQNKKQVLNDDIYIQNPRTIPIKYYVKSAPTHSCMFQISIQDYQNSILQLTQGFPTHIVLQYRESTNFLYYHNENTTFRIYEFIGVGSSNIYATPLGQKKLSIGLKQRVEEIKYSQFKYRGDQINNLQIQAKPDSQDYCFECFYLIKVRGNPAVQEELVVVRDATPVIIKEHSIVDSYLDQGQNQTFVYYVSAVSKFNLSIDVVYGRVTVTVKNYKDGPEGKVVRVQSVQKSMVNLPIIEKQQNSGSQQATDSLNQRQKYRIEVQGVSKALYHLQVIRYQDTFKLTQGIASKITIPLKGSIDLQFDSLVDQGPIQLNIQSKASLGLLMASVRYRPAGQNNYKSIQYTRNAINRVLVIGFNCVRGHYSIKLQGPSSGFAGSQMEIIALIPKPGLTQLRQQHSVRMNREAVFQIFIDQGTYAIIQVFDCQGNMKVRGSNQLKTAQRGSPGKDQVQLFHNNVGGHFVIRTPVNVSGQYFIRVQNKQYSAGISDQVSGISYMIKYRLQNNGLKNPYDYLDAQSFNIQLSSSPQRQNVTVKLNKIISRDPSIIIKQIRYILSIGKSADDVKDYMVCATQPDTQHLTLAYVQSTDYQTLKINVSKVAVLNKIGKKSAAYIGAYAEVLISQSNGIFLDNFVFAYEPAYMGQLSSERVISAFGLFQVIVIISLVLGGCVIMYALGVYLIRLYRGYSNTNQLVEQQSHNTMQEKPQGFEISQQKQKVSESKTKSEHEQLKQSQQ